ncbi:hypothetical protein CLV72_103186 [Allonocardiopsis opalescens]|uniref:Uncharacterized protein n=1 Tax=Allonocardiopsis opalescens TaxID=1144618 RepID=A0A2T0Q707_9ACTN|nr:hypothetical protein CLV72_103186 [Allonocardiopsis opalescens]
MTGRNAGEGDLLIKSALRRVATFDFDVYLP